MQDHCSFNSEEIQKIFEEQKDNSYKELIPLLIAFYFGTYENYLEEKSKLIGPKQFVCAKGIESQNELSFKCYDCGRESEFHMLCESCFMKGNHYKHRVQCGDSSAIAEEGFCSEHPGYKQMTESVYKSLNKEFRTKLKKIIKIIFQNTFTCFESAIKSEEPGDFLKQGNQILAAYQQYIEQEVKPNISLIFIVSTALMKTLKGLENSFYHDCTNTKDPKFLFEFKHPCDCTILENFFRFNHLIGKQLAEMLEHQIYTFFPNFEFKKYLVQLYVKMHPFIVSIEEDTKFDQETQKELVNYKEFISELRPIYTQFFDHSLQEIFMFSPYYEQIIYDLKKCYYAIQSKNFQGGYECFLAFVNMHYLFQNQKVALRKKLLQSNLQEIMLKLISSIPIKEAMCFKQQIFLSHSEMLFFRIFAQDLTFLNDIEQEVCSNYLLNLLKVSIQQNAEIVQQKLELDTTNKFNQLSFLHQNSFKMFGIILLQFLFLYKEDIQIFTNKIELFLKQWDPEKKILKKIFKNIYKGIAQAHRIFDSEVKSMNTSDYYFQFLNENPKRILDSFYFGTYAQFYDKDLSTTQILSLFFDFNWVCKQIYKSCGLKQQTEIKFDHQSVKIYQKQIQSILQKNEPEKEDEENKKQEEIQQKEEKNPDEIIQKEESYQFSEKVVDTQLDQATKKKQINENKASKQQEENLTHLNQFLEQLIYFVVDDIAILNNGRYLKTEYEPKGWLENSMKFIIIQMFSLQNSYKYEELRIKLTRQLLADNLKIDKYIISVASLNHETKQFHLKPEYQNLYEPYLFYKINRLSSQLFEQLEKTSSKNELNDMVIGNKLPYKQDSLFYLIQQKYSQSNLLYFIAAIILDQENLSLTIRSNIMKNALKLLHLIAQFLQINATNQIVLTDILFNVQKLKQLKEMADLARTLTKIEKQIQQLLQTQMNEEVQSETKVDKQNKLSDKQAEILLQYRLKQTSFLTKNSEVSQILNESEQQSKIENVCVVCHGSIAKTQWGYISYMTTDNASKFYYENSTDQKSTKMEIEEDQSQTYQLAKNLKENQQICESIVHKTSKYNYILNNCQHILHFSCYQLLLSKNQAYKKLFHPSQFELSYLCPICQMLANIFIPDVVTALQIPLIECLQQSKFDKIDNIIEKISKQNYTKEDLQQKLPEWEQINPTINEISSTLLMLLIAENTDIQNDNHILTVLESCLLYQMELILTDGLTQFLRKSLPMCQNLLKIYQVQFWNFDSNVLYKYINKKRDEVCEELGQLSLHIRRNQLDEIFNKGEDLRILKTMITLTIFFYLDSSENQQVLTSVIQTLSTKYIIAAIIAIQQSQNNYPKDCAEIITLWKSNEALRLQVFCYLKQFRESILGIVLAAFNFNEKIIEELQNKKTVYDEVQNFNKYFGNLINLNEEVLSVYGEQWLNELLEVQKKQQNQNSFLNQLQTSLLPRFSLPQIGINFLDFTTKNFFKQCYFCQSFPRKIKQDLYLCLICGAVMCNFKCKNSNPEKVNMDDHALKYHEGKTIFVRISNGKVILMDSPNSVLYGHLYFNNLGENYKETACNWLDYQLDNRFFEQLQLMIIRRNIPQKVVAILKEQEH